MIYKTTYRLCTVVLLIGIGLMHWKSKNEHQQHQATQKQWIQSMQNHNELLESNLEFQTSQLKRKAKKRKAYKKLFYWGDETNNTVEKFSRTIDISIEDAKYLGFTSQKHQELRANYQLAISNLMQVLKSMKSVRTYSIKPRDIKTLKEELNSVLTLSDTTIIENDSLNHIALWLEMKNKLLKSGFKVTDFLSRRIGASCSFKPREMIVSSSESQVLRVGELFKADIFLAQRIIHCTDVTKAFINGKSVPILDDNLIKYQVQTTKKGRIEYQVKMISVCPITKQENFSQKTFSYLVI